MTPLNGTRRTVGLQDLSIRVEESKILFDANPNLIKWCAKQWSAKDGLDTLKAVFLLQGGESRWWQSRRSRS